MVINNVFVVFKLNFVVERGLQNTWPTCYYHRLPTHVATRHRHTSKVKWSIFHQVLQVSEVKIFAICILTQCYLVILGKMNDLFFQCTVQSRFSDKSRFSDSWMNGPKRTLIIEHYNSRTLHKSHR